MKTYKFSELSKKSKSYIVKEYIKGLHYDIDDEEAIDLIKDNDDEWRYTKEGVYLGESNVDVDEVESMLEDKCNELTELEEELNDNYETLSAKKYSKLDKECSVLKYEIDSIEKLLEDE